MNKVQKRIFLITAGIVSAMGLFPPWHLVLYATEYNSSKIRNMGYSFIGDPPKNGVITVSILLLQILITALISSVLMYHFKNTITASPIKHSKPFQNEDYDDTSDMPAPTGIPAEGVPISGITKLKDPSLLKLY